MSNSNIPLRKTISSPNIHLLSSAARGGEREKLIIGPPPMRRSNAFSSLPIAFVSIFSLVSVVLYYLSGFANEFRYFSTSIPIKPPLAATFSNHAVIEDLVQHPRGTDVGGSESISSVAVLLPDWEVLVIVEAPGEFSSKDYKNFTCLYPNNVTSPAKFSGVIPSTNQSTFKCFLPKSCRRKLPFLAPVLTHYPQKEKQVSSPKVILRWNYLAYESFSTKDDVVLFVKGVNNRQGINRSPNEFNCIFTPDGVAFENSNISIRTPVTSSVQEVFRCHHPDLAAVGLEDERLRIKISLEFSEYKTVIPSVAYYTPSERHISAVSRPKHDICAATMVYNVGKFLREWIMYYKAIGVEKFILYDNDSDDNLKIVAKELNEEGYNVETVMWVWPKAQEAGFSHAALHARQSCNWLMFVDVDEFIFAPNWQYDPAPSDQMIGALVAEPRYENGDVGQVSVMCLEFGPSNKKKNPEEGVTQGYDCRRKAENRHKSIVLLEAIDHSLLNVIHHFTLKENYTTTQLRLETAVVNHYKFQAWSEFKTKFRRRVSAFVVDWKQNVNPLSKDRTPGLGFEEKEPVAWETKFCEVRDERLKLLAQRWFGKETENGYKMAWQ